MKLIARRSFQFVRRRVCVVTRGFRNNWIRGHGAPQTRFVIYHRPHQLVWRVVLIQQLFSGARSRNPFGLITIMHVILKRAFAFIWVLRMSLREQRSATHARACTLTHTKVVSKYLVSHKSFFVCVCANYVQTSVYAMTRRRIKKLRI